MFPFTWWNIKRARNPAINPTGALNQALADGDNLNKNVPILFKFKKPLNSRRQENTLVTSSDLPTSFGAPKFPVPYVIGGSTLDTFPVYAPTESNTYVDTTMMKKSVVYGLAILLDALSSLLALLAAGFACALFFTLWRDIDGESRKHTTVIEIEAMLCAWEYKRNDCSTRMIPGVYAQCLDWKRCANANQFPISRTKVMMQLAAETLDTFIRYLSYRTLAVIFFGFSLHRYTRR